MNTAKTRLVAVRLTDAQHDTIEKQAIENGLPVSTYMRHIALTQPKREKEGLTNAK